jgi:hypothetical protein
MQLSRFEDELVWARVVLERIEGEKEVAAWGIDAGKETATDTKSKCGTHPLGVDANEPKPSVEAPAGPVERGGVHGGQ